MPARLAVTEGAHGDVTWLDPPPIEPRAFYIMDRGYVDLRRLRRLHQGGAFFVVRERDDVRRYVAQSRPVDRSGPLRSDQTIRFGGEDSRKHWPKPERRRHLAFWTNQWELAAAIIAELYRQRWQVELFFRWIK